MKLLNSNVIVPFIAGIVIITFSLLFYFNITQRAAIGQQKEIGTLIFKQQTAQRKLSSQVIWDELEQNVKVYANDTIRTADISEAVIKLHDGTEIKLSENSMIVLSFSKDEIDINFMRGSIKAKRGDLGEGIKKLNIVSKNMSLSINKSDITLADDKNDNLNLTIDKGDARIKKGNKETVLKKDQQLVVSNNDLKVYDLKLKLIAPVSYKNFLSKSGFENIIFSWEQVKGNNAVVLEVSGSKFFDSIARTVPVNRLMSASLNLKSGIYYWRLKATNNKTKKLEFSESRRFSIVNDQPLVLLSPAQGASIPYKDTLPVIHFNWTGSDIASGHRLLVARDPNMSVIVKEMSIPGNGIAIDNLAIGTYYWRVKRMLNIDGVPEPAPSNVRMFKLVKTAQVNPPVLIYPQDKKSVSMISIEKKPLAFAWKTDAEIIQSRFEIASDNAFTRIVHSQVLGAQYVRLNKNLAQGDYYWRVAGILGKNQNTGFSGSRVFYIRKLDKLELLQPANDMYIVQHNYASNSAIDFSWKKIEFSGSFQLQIATNPGFTSNLKEASVQGFWKNIAGFEPGVYYWRVKAVDKEAKIIISSNNQVFTVLPKMAVPQALSPVAGSTVDMVNKDRLELQWKPVAGARSYRFELFQQKKGVLYAIIASDTTKTEAVISDLNKLDIGTFVWTVQAFDIRGNRLLQKSPVARNVFSISLGETNPGDKINFKSGKKIIVE